MPGWGLLASDTGIKRRMLSRMRWGGIYAARDKVWPTCHVPSSHQLNLVCSVP